jgi:asparagine synthase (glutamine-hydrolysing)
MCGVAGIFAPGQSVSSDDLTRWTESAANALRHRGPDDGATLVESEAGLALGHRRLSIIDLSETGRQPMTSASTRYVVAYNGEIYNFPSLRAELAAAGASFRGNSDTEVLLAAVEKWGFEAALKRANGMFAVALWDRAERCLYLARDRFGQKPLYVAWAGKALVFGSELSALRRFPAFNANVEPDALTLLLRHSAIPAPYTIYRDCWKLMPGTFLRIDADTVARRTLPDPVAYWSAVDAAQNALATPWQGSTDEAVEALEACLSDAVGACMVSDVPIGAFLSGGIDSSTVVALMQAQSTQPVRTFSIGFTEAAYNEAGDAAAVAKHLGTNHTELYITPDDAKAVIPDLPRIYDEPFADSSQIPTFLVSQLARQDVTVSLSGDGGDEMFAGYNRYTWSRHLDRAIRTIPGGLRRWAARRALAATPERWDKRYERMVSLLPFDPRQDRFGEKLHKLAGIIDAPTREAMYQRLISQWQNPLSALVSGNEPPTRLSERKGWPELPSFTEQIMLLDSLVYMPDDILVKLDRASMAVGLESRVPMLDHRVFEFAWSLPKDLKIREGRGKWILRKVLERHVPRALFERPKMGFGVPIGAWLREGDLRDWAEDLLSPDALARSGYFCAETIGAVWQEHLVGTRNHQHALWPVLMFEAWQRHHMTGEPSRAPYPADRSVLS